MAARQRLDNVVSVRFSDSEIEELRAAVEENLALSQFIRDATLRVVRARSAQPWTRLSAASARTGAVAVLGSNSVLSGPEDRTWTVVSS